MEGPEQTLSVLPGECIIHSEDKTKPHDPEAQVVQRSQRPDHGHVFGIEQEGKAVDEDEGEQEKILRRKGWLLPVGMPAEDRFDEDEKSQEMENEEPDTQDIPQRDEDDAESEILEDGCRHKRDAALHLNGGRMD
jgi:hypothetical protein